MDGDIWPSQQKAMEKQITTYVYLSKPSTKYSQPPTITTYRYQTRNADPDLTNIESSSWTIPGSSARQRVFVPPGFSKSNNGLNPPQRPQPGGSEPRGLPSTPPLSPPPDSTANTFGLSTHPNFPHTTRRLPAQGRPGRHYPRPGVCVCVGGGGKPERRQPPLQRGEEGGRPGPEHHPLLPGGQQSSGPDGSGGRKWQAAARRPLPAARGPARPSAGFPPPPPSSPSRSLPEVNKRPPAPPPPHTHLSGPPRRPGRPRSGAGGDAHKG